MNIRGVTAAVRARILADTGTGGIFNAGTPLAKSVYSEHGPYEEGSSLLVNLCPFLVVESQAAQSDDGFATDVLIQTFNVHVLDVVAAGADTTLKIMDRLYGDGIAQATRIATYGLHRWSPTLTLTGDAAAPWVASAPGCMFVASQNVQEQDVFHYVAQFQMTISRVRV